MLCATMSGFGDAPKGNYFCSRCFRVRLYADKIGKCTLFVYLYIYSLDRCPIVVAALTVQCGLMRPKKEWNGESSNLLAQLSSDGSRLHASEVTRSSSYLRRRLGGWWPKLLDVFLERLHALRKVPAVAGVINRGLLPITQWRSCV